MQIQSPDLYLIWGAGRLDYSDLRIPVFTANDRHDYLLLCRLALSLANSVIMGFVIPRKACHSLANGVHYASIEQALLRGAINLFRFVTATPAFSFQLTDVRGR